MSNLPALLFLHGVGDASDDGWRAELDRALVNVGYPDLSEVEVLAPRYPHSLRGVDDDDPLPKVNVKAPRRDAASRHRREFERRRWAMEHRLDHENRGNGVRGGDFVVPALGLRVFEQADNYINDPNVRAAVLRRVLKRLPETDRLVIIGHSLGSVIAADLIRRLPPGVHVAGLITIGSPLAHRRFHPDGLRELLADPPTNLEWWVNFWSTNDPVSTHRGVSTMFSWVLDQRIQAAPNANLVKEHSAKTYLQNTTVAQAIGFALFGSLSREVALVETGIDIQLDLPETMALLALRYAHTLRESTDPDWQARYTEALWQTQAGTVDQILERNRVEGRPTPSAIADLAVDRRDPKSLLRSPITPQTMSLEDAIVPLTTIATMNLVHPYEIEVSKEKRKAAMELLAFEMALGRSFGTDIFDAVDEARDQLKGPTNWVKWAAIGLGAAALVAATGGLALVAAPGAAGAAAITSALAAFGPGGMIGGLLTAGTLVTAGGGGLAIGLAAPGTTAQAVEAFVAAQLSVAIAREKRGLPQDAQTWVNLTDLEREVTQQLGKLKRVSDKGAPSTKELERKLDAIERAVAYIEGHGLGPARAELDD